MLKSSEPKSLVKKISSRWPNKEMSIVIDILNQQIIEDILDNMLCYDERGHLIEDGKAIKTYPIDQEENCNSIAIVV